MRTRVFIVIIHVCCQVSSLQASCFALHPRKLCLQFPACVYLCVCVCVRAPARARARSLVLFVRLLGGGVKHSLADSQPAQLLHYFRWRLRMKETVPHSGASLLAAVSAT